MIEKLEKHIGTIKAGNVSYDAMKPASINEMQEKINELVDAVNGILDYAPLEMAQKAEPEHIADVSKTIDPYAEQRKWIGCVCRFWFDNPYDTVLDYLGKIQTGENGIEYYSKETYDWFPHCEPVKPEDDIIYKGE